MITTSVPTDREGTGRGPLLILCGALVAQLALVSISFPISQLLTATPLFYIDSPYHWFQIETAKSLAASWRLVGYDPYFAAGYVGGVGFNASAKLPALLTVLLSPWLSDIVIYKLYVFCSAVIAPGCVPLAARWLGFPRNAAIAATVFGLLLWWLSSLRWYHTAGMVSYVFCCYLSLPYAALTLRFLTRPTSWMVPVALVMVGAVAILDHPLFPVPVAFAVLALTAAAWRELRFGPTVFVFVALPVLCLLPNLPWIIPTVRYPSVAEGVLVPYQKAVDISAVWQEALGEITKHARGSRLNAVLWFAAFWACAAPTSPHARRIAIAITIACIALVFFAALGAALPLVGTLQPNRYSAAAYLFLCIPAGLGIASVIEQISTAGVKRAGAIGSIALFSASLIFFVRELTRELSSADIPHHGERPPEVGGIGADSVWILSWLKTYTTPASRVLFESSGGRIHDNAHMAGYYALTADREFIGGPYPYMHFAGFWDGFLFGQSIEAMSREKFARYLDLYNIGSIIVFSEESKRFLDRQPGIIRREAFGPIQTYLVDGPPSFFLAGSGTLVARSFNRLEFARLSGPEIILKYHYVPGLQSDPPADIEPVSVPGDPAPFIGILNPQPHLVLKMQ